MSLADVATETLSIVERGWYTAPSGSKVAIGDDVKRAIAGTRLYTPAECEAVVTTVAGRARAPKSPALGMHATRIEVTAETTSAACRRLVTEGGAHVACLNFASAKNPGGGFLGGAKAQEEDIARRSALYPCLVTQPAYYEANRAFPSLLYTDHLIWSPRVPHFRDDGLAVVDEPWLSSIVTSPAPNAGETLRRAPDATPAIESALRRRAAQVLAVLAAQGAQEIVLGAWGCGVFRNDPAFVAAVFHALLTGDGAFAQAFDRVAFAIYDKSKAGATLRAFQEQFGAG